MLLELTVSYDGCIENRAVLLIFIFFVTFVVFAIITITKRCLFVSFDSSEGYLFFALCSLNLMMYDVCPSAAASPKVIFQCRCVKSG